MFKSRFLTKLREMEKKIKNSFETIKNELDMHLESINDNTSEIHSIHQAIYDLTQKVEKLSERLDEVYLLIGKNKEYDNFNLKIDLTEKEQQVFLVLYTLASEEGPMAYREIAKKLSITENLVKEYVEGLIAKGVPIIKKYVREKTLLDIDPNFKQLQAKHNVLHINEALATQFIN